MSRDSFEENVSYWPYQKKLNSTSLKIAFITLILPGLPGKSGGEIRDGHILGYLSANHHVDVFSINNFPNSSHYNQIISQINNLYYPEKICVEHSDLVKGYNKLSYLQKAFGKLGKLGWYTPLGKLPYEVEGFMRTFNAFTKELLQLKINEIKYDLIFVTPQVNPVFLAGIEIPKHSKCIFATYDVEKVRYKRLKSTHRSLLTKSTFPFEEKKALDMESDIISRVNGIIAVSELDRQTFINEYNVESSHVLAIENGVDTTYFSPNESTTNNLNNIVYVGNMGYPPNSQAVEYFVEEIMPLVLKDSPNTVFWAVGANASAALRKFDNGTNVRVTGEVPDVREYVNNAGVICIPLLTGSGTKYKVLEALSSQKPVVTTSIGAEGIDVIDGEHLLIRDKAADIAEAVLFCLSNKIKVQEMGIRGREFVVNHHEWKVVLPKMDDWFRNKILV